MSWNWDHQREETQELGGFEVERSETENPPPTRSLRPAVPENEEVSSPFSDEAEWEEDWEEASDQEGTNPGVPLAPARDYAPPVPKTPRRRALSRPAMLLSPQ